MTHNQNIRDFLKQSCEWINCAYSAIQCILTQ